MSNLKKRKRLSSLDNNETQVLKKSRFNSDDIFTLTSSNNKIIYSELDSLDDINTIDLASNIDNNHLLLQPIDILLDNIQNNSQYNIKEIQDYKPITINEQLWVDKYTPKRFRELLSNEKTNREVLRWIKQWDDIVFKNISLKQKDTRPEKKILLLSGQPGIGKTTLAHVLSKHAGYNTVEINASDDRTVLKFKPKIESAIEMKSVFGNCKPNFLIIDEIDGISSSEGNSIAKVLIDIATSTKKPLKRPIICICNDPYAPALRNLRKHTLLFKLEHPKTSILSNRLLEICKHENISIDAHTLSNLCVLANNDIRSCLNTLQFIKRRTNKITTDILYSSSIGHKDLTKSVFNIWNEIFSPQYKKQALKTRIYNSFGVNSSNNSSNQSSNNHIYNLIISNGNIDKIIEGCHSNYLSMKYLDTSMIKTLNISNSLAWASDISNILPQYSPFGIMKITESIPQETLPRLNFPSEQFNLFQYKKEYSNILQTFYLSIDPCIYNIFPKYEIIASYFSYFLKIITSNIRVANDKLLKDNEKKEQQRIVEIMNHYNIGFIQEMESDKITNIRSILYKLDPPIDKLCSFNNFNTITLNNIQKQSLASELEKYKFKSNYRKQKFKERTKAIQEKKKQAQELLLQAEEKNKQISQNIVSNITNNNTSCDFFGRNIIKSDNKQSNSPKYSKYSQHHIFFKYQEGFTNAVRRTVKIKDFL